MTDEKDVVQRFKENLKADVGPQAKLAAFSSMQGSLASLQFSAIQSGNFELGHMLGCASHLAGMASSLEVLKVAVHTPGASLTTFASSLGLFAGSVSLLSTLFGSPSHNRALVESLQAIYKMIVRGFTAVLERLVEMERRMDFRFDRLEARMDHHHFTTLTGLVELVKKGDDLTVLCKTSHRRQIETVERLGTRIVRMSKVLEGSMDLVTSNLNAFRHENLTDLVTRIHYYVSNGQMNQEKTHEFLANLQGAYRRLASNPHLTGVHLLKEPKAMHRALAGESSLDLIGLLVPPSKAKHVVHPAIVHVILTFFSQLVLLLDTQTPFHASFQTRLVEDLQRTKAALPHTPFHLYPPRPQSKSLGEKKLEDYTTLARKMFDDHVKASKLVLRKAARDVDMFSFFTKEMEYLQGGAFGQLVPKHAGKPAACQCSPACWAKMVFVDEHHKAFTQLHDGRAYPYGLLCRGGRYGKTACTGMHLSLYDEVAPKGCSREAHVIPFLKSVDRRSPSWVADEARTAIDGFIGTSFDAAHSIMLFITLCGDTFSIPYHLAPGVAWVSRALSHGFFPSLHLHIEKRRVFARVELSDCGPGFMELTTTCFKSETVDIKEDFSEFLKPTMLSALELFIWLVLCDRPYTIGSFGFRALHWNHDNYRSPSDPCVYHLPLARPAWTFGSILHRVLVGLEPTVAAQVERLAKAQETKAKKHKQPDTQKSYDMAARHLRRVKAFFDSII